MNLESAMLSKVSQTHCISQFPLTVHKGQTAQTASGLVQDSWTYGESGDCGQQDFLLGGENVLKLLHVLAHTFNPNTLETEASRSL